MPSYRNDPALIEAAQWALDEIEGRTEYPGSDLASPQKQRQNCIDKLDAVLAALRPT